MDTTALSEPTRKAATLYLAIETSEVKWQLTFGCVGAARSRRVTIAGRDWARVIREVRVAKQRFGLPDICRVVTGYEAGREGFWLDRALAGQGWESWVIDPTSPQVERRARRAKTDRLDGEMLLTHMMRYDSGERRALRLVRRPSVEQEDGRQLQREIETLRRDRRRVANRIESHLATQGLRLRVDARLPELLQTSRLWDGSQIPPQLRARLEREHGQWMALGRELAERMRERRAQRSSSTAQAEDARRLERLRALGEESAWSFACEGLGWREFRNRREVAAYMGLASVPYDSGESSRDQGISGGNRRMRALAVEISWLWLRYQPESALSKWYRERFGPAGRRSRRIGIVALARKLMIALWRYLTQGIVPEGAALKA